MGLLRQSLTKYLLSYYDIPTTHDEIDLAIFPHLPLFPIPHHVLFDHLAISSSSPSSPFPPVSLP